MVTNSNVTGTTLFLLLFRLKWFGMNEIRPNIPESEVCFSFLFEIWIRIALSVWEDIWHICMHRCIFGRTCSAYTYRHKWFKFLVHIHTLYHVSSDNMCIQNMFSQICMYACMHVYLGEHVQHTHVVWAHMVQRMYVPYAFIHTCHVYMRNMSTCPCVIWVRVHA